MKLTHLFKPSHGKKASPPPPHHPQPTPKHTNKSPLPIPRITIRPPTPPPAQLSLSDLIATHHGTTTILRAPPQQPPPHDTYHTLCSPLATGYLHVPPPHRRSPNASMPAAPQTSDEATGSDGAVQGRVARCVSLRVVRAEAVVVPPRRACSESSEGNSDVWGDEVARAMMLGRRGGGGASGAAAATTETPRARPVGIRMLSKRFKLTIP